MTRVLVLGGAGGSGQLVARLLAASDLVSELVIGSRRLEPAEEFARELGPKAIALRVDALKEGQVVEALSGCDLVVNLAGPEYVVSVTPMRAAIRAGADYCDIACEASVTEKALELDVEARKAGVTAITGIGAVPGVSNLLMMQAAKQFDQADSVTLCNYWPLSHDDLRASLEEIEKTNRVSAGWQMMLRWASGKVRSFEDGKLTTLDPTRTSWDVALPQGGTVSAHPACSPEPITLPLHLSGIRTIRNVIVFLPPQVDRVYHQCADRITSGEVDSASSVRRFLEAALRESPEWPSTMEGFPHSIGLWVTATGRKGARHGRYICWPAGEWLSWVGPAAVAGLRLLRGDVDKKGVLPPEACFEPMPFLAEVARYTEKWPADGKLLNERTEWD